MAGDVRRQEDHEGYHERAREALAGVARLKTKNQKKTKTKRLTSFLLLSKPNKRILRKRMYGTHHKTGQKIRLLQHSTTTWRSKKTLVWLNKENYVEASWNRLEVGCVGSETYHFLKKNGIDVDVLLCIDPSDLTWIYDGGYKNINVIVASRKILTLLGLDFIKEHKISNILCFEELHIMYSFLEKPWDGTAEDGCILISLILRFGITCISGFVTTDRPIFDLTIKDVEPPQPLYFITQYYEPKETKRAKEIHDCLEMNSKNKYIDKIILLNEAPMKKSFKKVEEILIHRRLYYDDVIRYIYENVPKDTIVVFANADIYLDETIRSIWSTSLENKFFALLRYEGGKIFGPRADSQDTWILSSTSVKERVWKYEDTHFSFGISGCDNAITMEMLRNKFLVVNPSLTIKTHHKQESGIRTHSLDEITNKDVYLYIEPSALHDMDTQITIMNTVQKTFEFSSFDRPIDCKKSATYCKMLEKKKQYMFNLDSPNSFGEHYVPIYKFSNVFQTSTGLLYDYNKIYVGTSKIARQYWSESNLSTLSPSFTVKKSYAVPFPESIHTPEMYILYYLPKILLLRKEFGEDGDFWAPNKREFIEALSVFDWSTKDLPLISSTENEVVYVKDAYVWFPDDVKDVHKEEMDILRNHVKKFPGEECVAVCMDGEYINKNFVLEIEKQVNVKVIFPTTTMDRKIAILQNATKCYVHASSEWAWRYIWCMKEDTTVIDIQYEMELNGEIHHIASACGLKHTIHLVPKGKISASSLSNTHTQKPTIYVPSEEEGFFSHAGDSFREIIDMWEERGYIKKEYGSNKNVWLGGVGETLLYDRPRYDWIKNADADEQMWKKALFGNPKPIGANSVAWSFWARRPRLVEAMLDIPIEKTNGLVFYGCIENIVQKNARTKYDWSSCCDIFVLSEKAVYTQQEYLDRIVKAKYGLCLAGFGKKCHREVECMAFGTVPVCSPEVDMDNYANPPKEGVHYFRVQNPEEALEKISKNSETWHLMSEACKVWYKENCSVDGIWNLTKKLCL